MLAGWTHHGLAILELNCFNFYSVKKVAKKKRKRKNERCTHEMHPRKVVVNDV